MSFMWQADAQTATTARWINALSCPQQVALNPDDPTPEQVSAKAAYAAARIWFQSNKERFPCSDKARLLIDLLPEPEDAWDSDMKAVFMEIVRGLLEFGYHESDGSYKIGAYAHAGLRSLGGEYLSAEDRNFVSQGPLASAITMPTRA
jgi:hypothetical protein